MFEMKVLSAFYLKNINVVALEGEVIVDGHFDIGTILIDKEKPYKKYISKGIYFVDGANVTVSAKKLNLQIEPGNFKAEDLIGRTLVSK